MLYYPSYHYDTAHEQNSTNHPTISSFGCAFLCSSNILLAYSSSIATWKIKLFNSITNATFVQKTKWTYESQLMCPWTRTKLLRNINGKQKWVLKIKIQKLKNALILVYMLTNVGIKMELFWGIVVSSLWIYSGLRKLWVEMANINNYYSRNCPIYGQEALNTVYLSSAHDRYPAIYIADHIWKCAADLF